MCVLVGGVLLGERGVTEREFAVDGGTSGRDWSGAGRSIEERIYNIIIKSDGPTTKRTHTIQLKPY